MAKKTVLPCKECERITAAWIGFDGRVFCDAACMAIFVLKNSAEYTERLLVDAPKDLIISALEKARIKQVESRMKAYISDPIQCPYCESGEIDYIPGDHIPPTCGVKCSDCGESWVEEWALIGIDDIHTLEVNFIGGSNDS